MISETEWHLWTAWHPVYALDAGWVWAWPWDRKEVWRKVYFLPWDMYGDGLRMYMRSSQPMGDC